VVPPLWARETRRGENVVVHRKTGGCVGEERERDKDVLRGTRMTNIFKRIQMAIMTNKLRDGIVRTQ
jgi:hypothetical protein